MTLRRQLVCLLVAGATVACSSSTPTSPGGGIGPTPIALSVTYTGQIRVDSCNGCVTTNGVLATRPFVLRLNEVSPGRVEGTFDFGYHSSSWAPLTAVSGTVTSNKVFKLSGVRTPVSPSDSSVPVTLTSLDVSEQPGGTLAGTADFSVSGTVLANGTYRSTLVSGTTTGVGTASTTIDGRWQGRTEIVSCTGDACGVRDVPGWLLSIAFSFSTQSSQLQGVAGSDNYFFLPGFKAALPVQGSFAGQTVTAGADTELIEYIDSDHVPPNVEMARVRVTVKHFVASIDEYNRLQGDITYDVVRTITWKQSTVLGKVTRGTYTVRLRDVVPKPL